MPKNVMKLVKPSPHRARNDFDLSHRHIMSMNFGELIPATTIETVPGDHIEMHVADLIRAIPMVTSPFLRAKQHIDVWFVPYHDLWHNFDNFITQKSQPVSTAFKNHFFLPHSDVYSLFASASNLDQSSAKDIVGRGLYKGSQRILQYLGYNDQYTGGAGVLPKVNLFRLAAYNYIWYNEYRQQYYDDGSHITDVNLNVAQLFNFDDLACDTEANAYISGTLSARLAGMTQMRYRCWKKDLYTGMLPSTQFGNVSTISSNLSQPFLLTSAGGVLDNRIVTTKSTGALTVSSSAATDGVLPSTYRASDAYLNIPDFTDVLALRKSEAIQIWREAALRAGNRVKDNMRAHYGVDSDVKDHRPIYLGSVSSPLNIGDVMTTASSTYSGNTNPNTQVGDIAGKGLTSLDEKVFKFDARDFGVIMAIASILPEAEYNAHGISRSNQLLESEDFFIPEYENLGLEPISSQNFHMTSISAAKVLGYGPRYWGYKTKLDKCYDIFMTGGINAPWCSPKYDVTAALTTPPSALPISTLYVNPLIFDVNFSVAAGVQPQFLADFYFDVDAVRPMSVVGLPFS